jgi:TolB-like protein/class 3 adenylate cyclase/Tfp pilus assembly protein PilF
MATQEVKRKLTAILSADVKGYSRLMGEDEVGTIRTLNAYKEMMANLIQQHHGRVVDAPGDNLLAEFASVVDAVQCAVEIQKELKTRNAELPENRRMEFRIGVNLGDVIEEENNIYGDGVNIAARMESLADGGGICISGTVYDHIENKLSFGYQYLGEQTVKNIAKPVRVYRVLMEPGVPVPGVAAEKVVKQRPWQKAALIAVAILIIIIAAVAIWKLYIRPTPPIEVASKEKMAFPLPDKPSIAVLPFVNMSGDPKEEYFSDGITEEIITALSKVPHLFVISRQSTFTYKNKPVKVKQVSEELGVQYVLEGSVRKGGDKVRITAQLIDAITGHHLWAERYDRDVKDIFALQDEITMKIITALQVKLTIGEVAHTMAKGTKNLEAYIKCMQSVAILGRHTKEGNAMGRKFAEEAIALDPKYSRAYVALAQTYMLDVLLGTTDSPEQSMAKARELIKKAIALDDSEPDAHAVLGYMYTMMGQHDKAIAEVERAVSLNPNSVGSLGRQGFVLLNAGRPGEAISVIKNYRRLSPSYTTQATFVHLAMAYRLTEQYKEAIETAKEALKHVPNNHLAYLQLVTAYSMAGQEQEARAAATEVMKINPKFSLERYAKTIYFKNQADIDRTVEALRKAGLK